MGALPDWQIERDIVIRPRADATNDQNAISYGVSSYGYDVRVGRHFKIFTNARCAVVDPKHFDPSSFVDVEGDHCLIPPNSFALAETVELLDGYGLHDCQALLLEAGVDVRQCAGGPPRPPLARTDPPTWSILVADVDAVTAA